MRHARRGDVMPVLMVVPYRPGRIEPRCKKRRPKQYDLMNQPRRALQEEPKNERQTAYVHAIGEGSIFSNWARPVSASRPVSRCPVSASAPASAFSEPVY